MTIPCLKVSEITSCIKELLEQSLPAVCVEGEISNCRPSSTGHLYFTLKDDKSAIAAVMFKGRYQALSFIPEDGMQVKVNGSISVYAQRGTYQIVADSMEQTGTGDILALLELRKQKLSAEGLFDSERKQPLPFFPARIGVVTSPTGAALRDILQIVKRRNPSIDIIILPAPVQGSDAAPIIAQRIAQANAWNISDVLIVGRGGGSLEDLLPFSEECVVRAVAASHIPVVSAVGHEIDWALSDFAADMRAPTPSAAAELCAPDSTQLLDAISGIQEELHHAMTARLQQIKHSMQLFSADIMEMQLRRIMHPYEMRFDDARTELNHAITQRTMEIRRRFELAATQLQACNPTAVLSRGFCIVRNKSTGFIIRHAAEALADTEIQIETNTSFIDAVISSARIK